MPTFVSVLVRHVKSNQAVRLVLIGLACVLVGAWLFSLTQHVSLGIGVYWAVTTATTVGYGDYSAKNTIGRVISIAVMLTTIPLFASAFALMAGAVVTTHLRRLIGVVHHEPTEQHVVILGCSPAVAPVAAELVKAGRQVVVVANMDRSALPEAVDLIAADPGNEEAVRRSHPEKAGQLLVIGDNDADVLVTAVIVRHIAPDVPTLAAARTASVRQALEDLGIRSTLSADELLVHTLAKAMEAPHAGELLLRLVGSDDYELKELPIDGGSVGRSLSSVRAGRPGLVLGLVHDGHVSVGVAQDPTLAEGDCLIVLEAHRA
jgi:voltage-gated potassium channel